MVALVLREAGPSPVAEVARFLRYRIVKTRHDSVC